mmetsp:Transcript_196/g.595  ORF Transcript_196/g.595 Transcript_196/m.595 type:complete len:291 (+) Transcript_196:3623-4495(+)
MPREAAVASAPTSTWATLSAAPGCAWLLSQTSTSSASTCSDVPCAATEAGETGNGRLDRSVVPSAKRVEVFGGEGGAPLPPDVDDARRRTPLPLVRRRGVALDLLSCASDDRTSREFCPTRLREKCGDRSGGTAIDKAPHGAVRAGRGANRGTDMDVSSQPALPGSPTCCCGGARAASVSSRDAAAMIAAARCSAHRNGSFALGVTEMALPGGCGGISDGDNSASGASSTSDRRGQGLTRDRPPNSLACASPARSESVLNASHRVTSSAHARLSSAFAVLASACSSVTKS